MQPSDQFILMNENVFFSFFLPALQKSRQWRARSIFLTLNYLECEVFLSSMRFNFVGSGFFLADFHFSDEISTDKVYFSVILLSNEFDLSWSLNLMLWKYSNRNHYVKYQSNTQKYKSNVSCVVVKFKFTKFKGMIVYFMCALYT